MTNFWRVAYYKRTSLEFLRTETCPCWQERFSLNVKTAGYSFCSHGCQTLALGSGCVYKQHLILSWHLACRRSEATVPTWSPFYLDKFMWKTDRQGCLLWYFSIITEKRWSNNPSFTHTCLYALNKSATDSFRD